MNTDESIYLIKKNNLIAVFLYITFCIAYYLYFTTQGFNYGVYHDYFTFVINGDFRKLNVPMIKRLDQGAHVPLLFEGKGLAYLYYYLPRSNNLGFGMVSLVVNMFCFLLTFRIIQKLNTTLGLKNKWLFLFLLNPQLIFYSQTINKEPFTLLFIFLSMYLILNKKYLYLVVIAILFTTVRQHHAVVLALFIFLYSSKTLVSFIFRLLLSHIFLSLISMFYLTPLLLADSHYLNHIGSVATKVIGLDKYGLGYFLLFPLKLLQNFYDQFYLSFWFIQDGILNLYKFKELLPNLVLISVFLIKVGALKIKFDWFYGSQKIYYVFIIVYLQVVSLNPVVHQRYLFPVVIVFLLIASNTSISNNLTKLNK